MDTVMIVEDEPDILELVELNLKHAGFKTLGAGSVSAAQILLQNSVPDLLLLDWMLPGQSGIEWLKAIRRDPRLKAIPVVLLTARSQEGDRLLGFEAGVDDYITKPFSGRELVARVRAVLRRAKPESDVSVLNIGRLQLDPVSHRAFCVSLKGLSIELSLTQTEFRMLSFFMRHPDAALSRERLLNAVWSDELSVDERTVDAQVRRLRNALKSADGQDLIETVRGEGYRLSPS